ncbi:MAG: ModD protein [Vitreoscilla sp.]|nr:ModD protein [Vitreoscilla sp.]
MGDANLERSTHSTASPWSFGLHDDLLRNWLREDAPHGDLSTHGLGLQAEPARIHFSARADMVVAGVGAAARLLTLCGVSVQVVRTDGMAAAAGEPLLSGLGPPTGVLLGWKVAQTLAEGCSGIATATAAIVRVLRDAGFATPLACTRKTFPGTRLLAAEAVLAGGGVMHRLGVSESLLVFPEHRALLPPDALAARLAQLRAQQPEKRLVVEGLNAEDALAMARAGADVLVSSAPYQAPPADIKVEITPA